MDPLLPEDFLCSLLESGYARILARARAVSQRHLDRLRALRERFPDALPQELLQPVRADPVTGSNLGAFGRWGAHGRPA